MAMPSGNENAVDRMSGGEFYQPGLGRYFPDERDNYISWIRAEFAAANAIIDSMCRHLQVVGGAGEYDNVVRSVQQRRCNWNSVLYMQQYFPVSDVVFALNQVEWGRQQRQGRWGGNREFRRSGGGFRNGQKAGRFCGSGENNHNRVGSSNGDSSGLDKNETGSHKSDNVNVNQDDGNLSQKEDGDGEFLKEKHEESSSNELEDGVKAEEAVHSLQQENDNQSVPVVSKTFVGTEICDGKMINVVDGLKLYESFYNDIEVSKLVLLVNELRNSGKRGQFPGQTYVVSKRPMKGRGRETIQLGAPIGYGPPEEENATGTSSDPQVEPVPALLEDVIERMANLHIFSVKPDSCIIDLYNEGDHSQPHNVPPWFGRPVCVLFLTVCDMTFGRAITVDRPGDYRGALNLKLSPGSLLMMEGKSADTAKFAIPSVRKQRTLITFTKFQPKKCMPSDGHRLTSCSGGQSSHWGPPANTSSNHFRHHIGHKPYPAAVPTTGVLPTPSIHPQNPPNGIPPLLMSNPVAPPMPFPAPVPIPPNSTGWASVPPRHPAPRLPIPGTGVFLPPPDSGIPSSQSTTVVEKNLSVIDIPYLPEKENGSESSSHNADASCQGHSDGKLDSQHCNGSMDATDNKQAAEEEQQQAEFASKPPETAQVD